MTTPIDINGRDLGPIEHQRLDAGIARTVNALRTAGFDTSDSGDGTGPDSTPQPYEKQAHGHVVVCVEPDHLIAETARIVGALANLGFRVVPVGPEPGPPPPGRCYVEAAWQPSWPMAMISIDHVLDRWGWAP